MTNKNTATNTPSSPITRKTLYGNLISIDGKQYPITSILSLEPTSIYCDVQCVNRWYRIELVNGREFLVREEEYNRISNHIKNA